MARRLAAYSTGLVISKPGVDALDPGSDDNLLFSTARKSLMQLGSGTITSLSENLWVPYGVDVGQTPLVFCRTTENPGVNPVKWVASNGGFTVSPMALPDGSKPAAGKSCVWAAFMRSQL